MTNVVHRRASLGRVGQFLENTADVVRFSAGAIRSVGKTRLYTSEVLRQAGILVLSSGLVIWGMEFVIGGVFAVEGHYISRQFGAQGLVAVFPALGGLRTCAPEMWGWILAAKVGCGIVAELGSMRITEEIDALQVMGIRPKPYLVGTRVLAAWIAMPFLYLVGLGLMYVASYLILVPMLGTVSEGGFSAVLWAFQSPLDILFSLLWTMVAGTLIVLVACYYGFNARGGPVGVGMNTAKSMLVNMVLISVVGMICQQLFWGGFPNAPIGN
ncbi:ABC transporter permease [Amycolatopsis stemonae]